METPVTDEEVGMLSFECRMPAPPPGLSPSPQEPVRGPDEGGVPGSTGRSLPPETDTGPRGVLLGDGVGSGPIHPPGTTPRRAPSGEP